MESPVLVDPFRCRLWGLHDALDQHIGRESVSLTTEAMGPQRPTRVSVLGRPVHGDRACDVEIMSGGRRLLAARHLNMRLLVEVRELSDKEAVISMHEQNVLQKGASPHERGRAYRRWLDAGCFTSQAEMAAALGVSPSRVSRLLKIARLPEVILQAFGSPVRIREAWGARLAELLEHRPTKQPVLLAARRIVSSGVRLPAQKVYRLLLASAASSQAGRKAWIPTDKVVAGEDGEALFRISQRADSVALLLPVDMMSTRTLGAIRRAIVRILTRAVDVEVDVDVPTTRMGGIRQPGTQPAV
jgi:ParB family chromosome partitioning protein